MKRKPAKSKSKRASGLRAPKPPTLTQRFALLDVSTRSAVARLETRQSEVERRVNELPAVTDNHAAFELREIRQMVGAQPHESTRDAVKRWRAGLPPRTLEQRRAAMMRLFDGDEL